MDERSDADLIRAYRSGDERAFDVLIFRYTGPIYRFAYRLIHDRHAAEDLTQETFVKAWKSLGRFDASKSFKAWIFAIARNATIDHIRKKDPITFSALETSFNDGDDEIPYDVEDTRPLPDEVAIREEELRALDAALADLPPNAKSVILMHDGEGLTFQEIADSVKEPLNTVKSRYRRAVERLRKRFGPTSQHI